MPLARIRTFDPEAIAFLAAKLAASGYQLQFAKPGEELAEEADLDITVTRMDVPAALKQAQLQAEQLGVDITIMPGVLRAPEPEIIAAPVEVAPEPVAEIPTEPPVFYEIPVVPETVEADETASFEPATYYEPSLEPSVEPEPAEHSPYAQGADIPRGPSKLEEVSQSAQEVLSRSLGALNSFSSSSREKLEEWKRRYSEAQTQRRADREQQRLAALEEQQRKEAQLREEEARLREEETTKAPVVKIFQPLAPPEPYRQAAPVRPRLVVTESRPMRQRDRTYRRAAVAAAAVVAAGMLVWGLTGRGGPANPLGKSGVSNVQQQVPFGAASVAAPAQPIPPNTSRPTQTRRRQVSKPKPNAARPVHTQRRVAVPRNYFAANNDSEVVVHHFGTKPVAQQAKAKTKDGVKVISEE